MEQEEEIPLSIYSETRSFEKRIPLSEIIHTMVASGIHLSGEKVSE